MVTKTDTDTAAENVAAALGGKVINETGKDVAENVRTRVLEDTRSISSFEQAIQALAAAGVEAEQASEFELVKDKKTLVGIPMVFLNWRFNEDEKGREFVSVEAVTKDGRKVIFNDGSKRGIRDQLKDYTESKLAKNPEAYASAYAGLIANAGLRESEYSEEDGAAADGSSWYIQGMPVARKR